MFSIVNSRCFATLSMTNALLQHAGEGANALLLICATGVGTGLFRLGLRCGTFLCAGVVAPASIDRVLSLEVLCAIRNADFDFSKTAVVARIGAVVA